MTNRLPLMALFVFSLGAASVSRAATMKSATNILYPGDYNSSGEDDIASAASYKLGDSLGEAVSGERMTSSAHYQLGGGLRQIIAYPNAVADLSAKPIGISSATLSWSSPGYDGAVGDLQAGASYYVALATFVVSSPFSSFNGLMVAVSTSGVSLATAQSLTISGLNKPAYYVQIWTVDADGNASFGSNVSSFTSITAAITNFLAAAGLKKAMLTWSTTASGIASFHIYRSTDNVTFVDVATTTVPSLIDAPLVSYATYYYKVAPVNLIGGEGQVSVVDSVIPFTLPPLVPLGLAVTPGPTTVSFSWSTTTHFSDGTVFYSTASPSTDELLGYNIYRSTGLCSPVTLLANQSLGDESFTDNTGGGSFFYQVQSYNSLGASTATVLFDTLGQHYYVADDCNSRMILPLDMAEKLNNGINGYKEDIAIIAQTRPQDTGGETYQSVDFVPLLGGHTKLANFTLPKPVPVQLHYKTVGGLPVPSVATWEANAGGSAAAGDLGMYWNNGNSFQKMYGKVDALDQLVTVQSPNLGIYQIRALARSAGVVFDVSNISSRVITPNGDGKNDTLIFTYDPGPNNVQPEGKIYDLGGRYVADMGPGLVPNTLTWDGRMGGRYVTSGVYVYQIKGDGKTFNGTIVVAR